MFADEIDRILRVFVSCLFNMLCVGDCNSLNIHSLHVVLYRWKRDSMNCDIARVKSFFTAYTFNFSSSHMSGRFHRSVIVFHNLRNTISDFRHRRSRFMLKLKSYSFPSECIGPFSGFCAYPPQRR